MMISKELRESIKLSDMRAYQIARLADLHPSTLSQIMRGIVKIKKWDERVMRVGKVLGFEPEKCFSEEDEE